MGNSGSRSGRGTAVLHQPMETKIYMQHPLCSVLVHASEAPKDISHLAVVCKGGGPASHAAITSLTIEADGALVKSMPFAECSYYTNILDAPLLQVRWTKVIFHYDPAYIEAHGEPSEWVSLEERLSDTEHIFFDGSAYCKGRIVHREPKVRPSPAMYVQPPSIKLELHDRPRPHPDACVPGGWPGLAGHYRT